MKRHQRHGVAQDNERKQTLSLGADADLSCERQQSEIAERLRQCLQIGTENDNIAGLERGRAQPPVMRLPRRLTARRLISNRSNNRACAATDPTSSDSGVMTASITPMSSVGVSFVCSAWSRGASGPHVLTTLFEGLQARPGGSECRRPSRSQPAGAYSGAWSAARKHRDDLDLVLAEVFQVLDRLADHGCLLGHHDFGRVALRLKAASIERRPFARWAKAASRKTEKEPRTARPSPPA